MSILGEVRRAVARVRPLSDDERDLLGWLADREDGRVPFISARHASEIEHVGDPAAVARSLRRRGYVDPDASHWSTTPDGRAAIGR